MPADSRIRPAYSLRVCGQWILMAAAIATVAGCHSNPPPSGFLSAEQITLFSIDGTKEPTTKTSDDILYGYPVLGRLEIKDAAAHQEIVDALNESLAVKDRNVMAACFWPRHVVRVVANGQTVDFVICFHCSQYSRDSARGGQPITKQAKPVLNKYLTGAGVPLAPEEE